MVFPGTCMLEVGFSAMLTRMSCPVEMPPMMPPALFDKNPSLVISSRCSEPRWVTLAKPEPIGIRGTLQPAVAGTLYLRINDSPAELGDNAGTVRIGIRRGAVNDN